MNFKISIFFILISFSAFTQSTYPTTSIINQDTVIIFSQEQGRKIAEWNEERKLCFSENEILNSQLEQKDTIISILEKEKESLLDVEYQYQEIIQTKDELLEICESEKDIQHKEIKRQKRHKWISIISGITLGVLAIII